MRSPRAVELAVTAQCNLRCNYCSHFTSGGDTTDDLPASEWLTFFGELSSCAVMTATICGGEPFFRQDLPELIEGIVRNRMRFKILTNGTLISEDDAAFLASTGRCDTVQVSIDGSGPDTHETMRGSGTFERALRGVERLRAHNVPVSVRVTIHRKNVTDLDLIAKLLLVDLGLPGFSTNAASHMGLCRQNAEVVQLTAGERTLAMETLLELNQEYGGRIGASAGPLAEARMWLEMERARRERKPPMQGRGCLTSCGGVMNTLGVRADGVMVPCIQLSHVELGRINVDSVEAAWRDHPELERLRTRSSISLTHFETCNGCDYLDYCRGGCPALAYTIVGDENHPSPDACLRRFIAEGGKLPAEVLIS